MTDNPVLCNPIMMIILTTIVYCVVKIIGLMYVRTTMLNMYVQSYNQYGEHHQQTKYYGDRFDHIVDRIDNFNQLMIFCNTIFGGWLLFN